MHLVTSMLLRLLIYPTIPVSNPQHSDKGMTLDTSNYNENMQIFLKIADSDTWHVSILDTHIRVRVTWVYFKGQ